ncbi:MAG: DNA internalization-related competence protein ComEC/Rec2 [Limnochordales bacterium]|nr:DNA internalization-related competence protein ComEC/Rec2 [Limnochordales bacterium]
MGDRTLRRPLLWVVSAWASGILLAYSVPVSPGAAGGLSLILVMAVGWQAWREWRGESGLAGAEAMSLLLLLGVVLGGACAWSADREKLAAWPLLRYRSFGAERREPLLLEGVVLSCYRRPPDKREGWEVVLRPERWQSTPGSYALSLPSARGLVWQEVQPPALVLLYVFAQPARAADPTGAGARGRPGEQAASVCSGNLASLLPGDRIRVAVELRRPEGDGNPGDFSFAAYLARRRILAVAYADSSDVAVLVGSRAGGLKLAASRYLTLGRRWFLRQATKNLPQPFSALAAGVILGDKEEMTEAMEEAFRRSGLSHLLSVSGLHVGLLAGLLYLLSKSLRLSSCFRRLLIVVGVAAYVGLCGASPPATRAGLMITVFTLLGEDRSLERVNLLAASALFMLMRDPFLLHDLGFQLSFAATAGLLLWSGRLWSLLAHWHPWFGGQVGASLAVTLVAQLSTLPIIWAAFSEVAVWGLLASLLVTPVMGAVVPLASIHAICAALPGIGWLEWISRMLLLLPLRYSWAILEAVGRLPVSLVRLPPPPPGAILVLAALAVRLAMIQRGGFQLPFHHLRPVRPPGAVIIRGLAAVLVLICLGSSLSEIRKGRHLLHVYFFDVGQGDAALLLPEGGRGILVDTGPAYAAERLVAAVQRVTGTKQLEAVFLSHAHDDHMGGLPVVLTRLQVKRVWYGPGITASPELQHASVPAAQLEAGDWQHLPGGLTVEVLWPGKDAPEWSENNRSLVLLFTYGLVGLLFPGDLESSGQQALCTDIAGRQLRSRGAADLLRVLKVPHHGGRTAWWKPFYRQIWPPEVAVISVGRNSFGHPDRHVTASLAETGLVLRTDLFGAVHLITDGQRLIVEVWVRDEVGLRRPRSLRLWDSQTAVPNRT